MSQYTRRRLLAASVASAGVLAGCLGEAADDSDDGAAGTESSAVSAQASFFVFGDLATQVAGETATAETLVPIGQHGHGWEPGPRIRESIREADLFVHVMAGFQPWADDILQDLDADGADVATVDVSAGLDLFEPGEAHDHGEETGHGDHEADGHEGEAHEEETHNDSHEGDGTEESGHDEHDHAEGMDPHFWTDPLRAKAAVSNVQQGLTEVDGDNADRYEENAKAFRDRLDELHERIESTVDEAAKEVVLLAGHDAFQYFGDRYGVRVEALTDVSPDDQPTPRSIERAQNVIREHDLRYICADPLESQEAAEQLVAETDAEAVLPLTSMPGRSEEWAEEGWGYVEIIENVNLPTLERALDA